jgi:hypothetical protein
MRGSVAPPAPQVIEAPLIRDAPLAPKRSVEVRNALDLRARNVADIGVNGRHVEMVVGADDHVSRAVARGDAVPALPTHQRSPSGTEPVRSNAG